MSVVSTLKSLLLALLGHDDGSIRADRSVRQAVGDATAPYCIVSVDNLLRHSTVSAVIEEIRVSSRVPQDEFLEDFYPLLVRHVEMCQLIPASKGHHHQQPLGLLLHQLYVAQFALSELHSFTPFYPSPPPDGDLRRYERRGRQCIFAFALCHDYGKLQTSEIELRFTDPRTGRPFDGPSYSPHGKGGKFSQSPLEFAQEHFQKLACCAQYRIHHKPDRLANGHDSDALDAVNAMFQHCGIGIDDDIRKAYLDVRSALFQNEVKKLKQHADRHSVELSLERLPPDRNEKDKAYLRALRDWALRGELKDLPLVNNLRFLPQSTVQRLLPALPDYEEFSMVSRIPVNFLHDLKVIGVHKEPTKKDGDPTALYTHQGEVGLLLSVRTDMALCYYEVRKSPNQKADQHVEIASEPVPHQVFMATDVSSVGVKVPTVNTLQAESNHSQELRPAAACKAYSTTQTIPSANRRANSLLRDDLPSLLQWFASHLDLADQNDFKSSRYYYIENNRLHVRQRQISRLFKEFGLEKPECLEEFVRLSDLHARHLWITKGDKLLEGVVCTEQYSAELLSTQRLDASHSQLLPSASVTPPSAVPDKAASPPIVAARDVRSITATGFTTFLHEEYKRKPSNVSIEGPLIRVSTATIDQYVGQPSYRGTLINVTSEAKLFRKKSKHFYFFDRSHKDIASWLNG